MDFPPWGQVVNTALQGKHARRAVARIAESLIVRREPLDQHPDHAPPLHPPPARRTTEPASERR